MKQALVFISLLTLLSCSRPMAVTQVSYAERRMSDSLTAFDPGIEAVIRPYRDSMQAEMKQVIVISDTILTKQMPESDLGDILADILLDRSQKYTGRKVDFAVINFGGIRISQLPAGNITKENAFELMPFDNRIVLLDLDGPTAQKLFDRMAAGGGVPVSGARYVIDTAKKAINITIQGKAIDPTARYTMAISDYLANGGDNLDMLKPLPQVATGRLLRDAFIEGFSDMYARGQHLRSRKDGRVTKKNN
jgi:2',3'-cyclic-nucleotide 2'-phosphodiesterase (5'-nucleotidase family)